MGMKIDLSLWVRTKGEGVRKWDVKEMILA